MSRCRGPEGVLADEMCHRRLDPNNRGGRDVTHGPPGCQRRQAPWLFMVVAAIVLTASCTAEVRTEEVSVPEVTGAAVVGAPANRLGVKWDWSRVNSFAPFLRQMSGGTTFFELVWCEVQPTKGSSMRWDRADAVAAGAAKLGFTLAFKVRTGTCWVTAGRGGSRRGDRGKTASAYPADESAYDTFVAAAVGRYAAQGIDTWAIENEVNASNFWVGTPEEYERLAVRAANQIRKANPRAVIADFGLSSTGWGTVVASDLLQHGREEAAVKAWTSWFARRKRSDFPAVSSAADLTEALTGAQAARNLAMFAVAERLAASHVVDITQVHFYESPENVQPLVDLLRRRIAGRVEAWEVGRFDRRGSVAGPDRDLEANEAIKTVVSLLGGGVGRVIWLPAAVNPEGRNRDEPRAGLMDPDGTTRPAGSALAALVPSTAVGVEILALPSMSRLQGAVFDLPDLPAVLVAWASKGSVSMPTAGIVVRSPSARSASDVIDIGPDPVVIEVRAGVAAAIELGST